MMDHAPSYKYHYPPPSEENSQPRSRMLPLAPSFTKYMRFKSFRKVVATPPSLYYRSFLAALNHSSFLRHRLPLLDVLRIAARLIFPSYSLTLSCLIAERFPLLASARDD
jgi:hypothetical protein